MSTPTDPIRAHDHGDTVVDGLRAPARNAAGARVVSEETRQHSDAGFVDDDHAHDTEKVSRRRPRLADGTVVDRYVVLAHLGSGGMGAVYMAWDQKLGRRVALKLMHAVSLEGEQHAVRLEREARALARLNHDNVVRVFDVGEWQGAPYITMELVDGRSLKVVVNSDTIGRTALVRLFIDAARGLAAAHHVGVIHRDVKADNIFVGSDQRARVGDFGIATVTDEHLPDGTPSPDVVPSASTAGSAPVTIDGALIGTPAFMAPEQLEGRLVDGRCDQFGLCVALWWALFKQDPFPTPDTLLARFERMRAPPQTPAQRWPAMEAVLARGLRFSAADRHPDMSALAVALEGVLRRPRRQQLVAAVVAGCLVTSAAAVALVRRDPCDVRAHRQPVDEQLRASPASPLLRDTLNHWLARWSSGAVGVCEHDELSEVERTDRLRCFDARLHEVSSLVTLLGDGQVSDDAALQAALSLPAAALCLDGHSVTSTDAAQVATMARARMALLAGDPATAVSDTEVVLVTARQTASASVVADAALLRGRALSQLGRWSDAEALVREGIAAAMASSALHVEAELWVALVDIVGDKLKRATEATALLPWMRAAIERLPPDVDLRSSGLIAEAMVENDAGHPRRAADLAGQALAVAVSRDPINPHTVVGACTMQSQMLTIIGETARAVEVLERGRGIVSTSLPPGHIRFAVLDNALGLARRKAGDLVGARAAFASAIAVIEGQPRPLDHAAVWGVPLTNLAHLDILAGDTAAATDKASRARALLVGSVGEGSTRVSYANDALALAAALEGRFDDARRHCATWLARHAAVPTSLLGIRAAVLDATLVVEVDPDRLSAMRARLAALQPTLPVARASLATGQIALALAGGDVDEARRMLADSDMLAADTQLSPAEVELLTGLRLVAQTGRCDALPTTLPAGRLVKHRACDAARQRPR